MRTSRRIPLRRSHLFFGGEEILNAILLTRIDYLALAGLGRGPDLLWCRRLVDPHGLQEVLELRLWEKWMSTLVIRHRLWDLPHLCNDSTGCLLVSSSKILPHALGEAFNGTTILFEELDQVG